MLVYLAMASISTSDSGVSVLALSLGICAARRSGWIQDWANDWGTVKFGCKKVFRNGLLQIDMLDVYVGNKACSISDILSELRISSLTFVWV